MGDNKKKYVTVDGFTPYATNKNHAYDLLKSLDPEKIDTPSSKNKDLKTMGVELSKYAHFVTDNLASSLKACFPTMDDLFEMQKVELIKMLNDPVKKQINKEKIVDELIKYRKFFYYESIKEEINLDMSHFNKTQEEIDYERNNSDIILKKKEKELEEVTALYKLINHQY